jgi:putative DNA primase/helicase
MLALAKRVARTIHIEASTAGDDRREKVGKWALSSGMLSRLNAMISCACPAVAVTPDAFDSHATLLNCRNGTLELDTLTFREARREDLLTKQAGVDYDPSAACPTWLAHLDLIFGGDVEVISGFQQMAGYSLLDGNPEQVMFILLGRGKNGKSVTLRVLSEVLGDYAVNIAAESLMVKRNDTIRSDLARLMGARLVTSAEGGEGAALDEGAVKQLTGFDDKITVARKYENEFEFTPSAKIWFATNHAPKIRGTDDGIWRRIWLIPFEVQIAEGQRDPQITEKLLQEKQGILNWMLDGLRQYHAQGHRLQPAAKIVAATRAYRRESDVFGRFLADEMVFDPAGSLDRAALYRIYTEWCKEEGELSVAARTIAKYLRERQVQDAKRGGARCWIGIRLKDTMEAERDAAAGSAQAGL